MNTRLGKSFGLAFVVAVGILALMFALGTFNAQKVGAQAPNTMVMEDTILVAPANPSPGANSEVKVSFQSLRGLDNFTNVTITLEGWGLPASIDIKDILMHELTIDGDGVATITAASSGLPVDVTVDGDDIILQFDDDTVEKQFGFEGVQPTSGRTQVVIRKRAGLTAPATAGSYDVTVDDETEEDAVTVRPALKIDPTKGGGSTEIEVSGKAFADGTGSLFTEYLSTPDANNDGIVDVIAYIGEITDVLPVAVGDGDAGDGVPDDFPVDDDNMEWGIDVDGDGDADYQIFSSNATGDAVINTTTYVAFALETDAGVDVPDNTVPGNREMRIIINGSPFANDAVTPPVVATPPSLPKTNYTDMEFLKDVTVADGAFSTTIEAKDLVFKGAANRSQIRITDANGGVARKPFQVTGTLTLGSDSVGKGKILEIALSNWIANVPTRVTIGGVDVADAAKGDDEETGDVVESTFVDEDGNYVAAPAKVDIDEGGLTLYVKVTGDDVRLGTKTVVLFDDTAAEGDERLDGSSVEITAVGLDVSPSSAVAGQVITVEGSGFTDPSTLTEITVDGIKQTTLTNRRTVISTAVLSGGRIVVSFKVPDGVTDGSQIIRVTDGGSRIGEGTLVVPEPTITLEPPISRRGTTVYVSGTGFPADSNISLDYGDAEPGIATGRTDGTGTFMSSFAIPSTAGIGDDVMVKASITLGEVGYTDEATHSVPDLAITVTPEMARSGDTIVIVGTGFPRFSDVEWKIGAGDENFRATTTRTDDIGDFTMSITMPGIDPGTHVLQVQAGTETGSWVLNVPEAAVITTMTSEEAFAELISADNLIVVWYFDNDTKGWSFYDPRPEVAAAVDLTMVNTGDNVWIQITADQMFQGEMRRAGWNLVTLN